MVTKLEIPWYEVFSDVAGVSDDKYVQLSLCGMKYAINSRELQSCRMGQINNLNNVWLIQNPKRKDTDNFELIQLSEEEKKEISDILYEEKVFS